MFWKIAFVAVAIIALMVVAPRSALGGTRRRDRELHRDPATVERAGRRAGTRASKGVLTGFPALESDGCDSIRIVQHEEVWRCPAPLVSTPGY